MAKSYKGRERKKGTTELLVLSLIGERQRHGYELAKLIEERSNGALTVQVASLYPLLYRLERRGWIEGKWVEKSGQRRRRFYALTVEGRRQLERERSAWLEFAAAVERIARLRHA